MLFNSLQFLIFFPIVFFLYYLLPHKMRGFLLLAASFYFYIVWKPLYVFIILGTTSADYIAGLLMSRTEDVGRRKLYLLLSLAVNLGVLFYFKYFNFFLTSAGDVSALFGGSAFFSIGAILLPLGISFHTFQGMGYAIDVYRKKLPAEKNYFTYALFVMFFPQLVAGPIERGAHMFHQFKERHEFNYQRVSDGLKLATWGMFKKIVIADRVGSFVDTAFANPSHYAGPGLALATVLFAVQIYCDFSGYTDIAIGTAQMLGFDLMNNFRRPYAATSMHEFWQRWHISLSTWFRDYVYIPLGGNRVGRARWYFNLLATFIISGFWHGAAWTFLIWGALNGLYIVVSHMTTRARAAFVDAIGLSAVPRVHHYVRIAITFFLTCVAWVFFRATSFHDAIYILTHIFVGVGAWFRALLFAPWSGYAGQYVFLDGNRLQLFIAFVAIVVMELVQLLQGEGDIRHLLSGRSWYVRWPVYVGLVIFICAYGVFGQRKFIYFTF